MRRFLVYMATIGPLPPLFFAYILISKYRSDLQGIGVLQVNYQGRDVVIFTMSFCFIVQFLVFAFLMASKYRDIFSLALLAAGLAI